MGKNNKVTQNQNIYQNLLERYEEMNDYLLELIDESKRQETDLRYLNAFIHFKKLDEEFRYFKENAHEEQEPELPFPYLSL